MKNLVSFLMLFLVLVSISAQPTIQWQTSLGGTNTDYTSAIQQTSDGGYITAGFTLSSEIFGNHGGGDIWVMKLNSLGTIQWQKCLGGTSTEHANSICQTSDGGYIVAGETFSNNGNVSGNHGGWDYWVIKLSTTGVIEWQKTLGGSGEDYAYSIQQTNEGGYIVAGYTGSTDGDVSGNHGYADFWVVKLDASGTIQWQKALGGSEGAEFAYCIRQTMDEGYIVAGESQSTDGDVSGNQGNFDDWVVKLSGIGDIEWQKTFGGNGYDSAKSIVQTSDEGYILVGVTGSFAGDVSGNHGIYDFWVVKLSKEGNLEWQKALGGSDTDSGQTVCQANDGGYLVAGYTYSKDGDAVGGTGDDILMVKLNGIGEIQWKKVLGGSQAEAANSIIRTADGGYILACESYSNDGDVSGNHGGRDAWIVKLSPESSPTSAPLALPLEIFPNPATNTISLKIPTLSAEVSTEAEEEPAMTVSISDLLGREVSHQTISNSGEIDIAMLPNGLYLLTATTPSGKVFSEKFRKQE